MLGAEEVSGQASERLERSPVEGHSDSEFLSSYGVSIFPHSSA